MSLRGVPPAEIFDKALGGERRALGRLITFVERDAAEAEEIAELAHARAGNAHVIGITGAPGSGKSTLTGQLVKLLGEADKRAAQIVSEAKKFGFGVVEKYVGHGLGTAFHQLPNIPHVPTRESRRCELTVHGFLVL